MKLAFIDYYLDEWHANNYPAWIREASGGEMEVACAWGKIDSPIGGRTNEAWCRDMGIPQAGTIEEAVEGADGIIVLSPDNCEMHEELSRVPLASGKPTYIDKTFAPDLASAKRIFALAEKRGTPCYSTSALRYADEYRGLGQADCVASWGPNGFETYSVHQLEPIMMLIGSAPRRVMALKGEDWYQMAVEFEDGRAATLAGYQKGAPFAMNVTGKDGAKAIRVESDFFGGFIRQLVAFFRDPSKIVPHRDTLRIMAVRGAGVEALKRPGEWIPVEKI